MAAMYLARIAQLMGGKLLQGHPETLILSYTFDSRTASPGALFFALKGTRDGHEYLQDAYKNGAIAACVSRKVSGLPPEFGLIQVDDTLKALQELAAKFLAESRVKVVGITGSIGKTSTKEFTARLLSVKYKVHKSKGNFNNHIGLPISILSMDNSSQIAVLEMAMSQAGEIKKLTEIAPPDVAVITGIAPVHLEFFNSLEDIALAKKEILDGAKPGAVAILNGDDPLVRKMSESYTKGPIIFFGREQNFPVRAENVEHLGFQGIRFDLIYGQEKAEVKLPFLNEGLISNLLAACGVAYYYNFQLDEVLSAISDLPGIEHRGQLLELKNGIKIYDDSYNSNPVALTTVLKSLAKVNSQRKIAVLGDMLELGPQEAAFHLEVGKKIPEYGWDVLVTVGPRARYFAEGAVENGFDRDKIFSFSEAEEATSWLKVSLQPGDFLLIKGSRGLALDRIVENLKREMED